MTDNVHRVEITKPLINEVLKYLYHCAKSESCYGFFCGGDPRDFTPDTDNRPEEITLWKEHCELAEKGEVKQDAAGQWIVSEGHTSHLLRAKYGPGIQVFGDKEAESLIRKLHGELGYARKDHPVPEG